MERYILNHLHFSKKQRFVQRPPVHGKGVINHFPGKPQVGTNSQNQFR